MTLQEMLAKKVKETYVIRVLEGFRIGKASKHVQQTEVAGEMFEERPQKRIL